MCPTRVADADRHREELRQFAGQVMVQFKDTRSRYKAGEGMKKVLISGASIAGPTLAWWLRHHGFAPTLVERMPGAAKGGHAIDVRGVALDVLEAMKVRDAAYDERMRMTGVSIIDQTGSEVWRSEEMTISGGKFDNDDIEILRDKLSHVLVGSLPSDTEILYGDSIQSLEESEDGVIVTLAKGGSRQFDLVIGADGLRSNVRNLVFGGDREFLHPFGIALAPFSAPNTLGIKDWQISYRNGKDGYMIYTAPGNEELRICFNVPAGLDDMPTDRSSQIAAIREHCGNLGWETPRFLDEMEVAPDFYLGLIAQVRMDRWTKGRVALVGDAGYSPTPYTGQGTSLAVVGAYVLAHELARTPDDHAAAFARYEAKLRPFVEANHAIAELTRDPSFTEDPEFYTDVVEPVIDMAKVAIELEGLGSR
jgi:2-polyprenyl-6-methoxyphenol hydroxylase-like FAD-dependent oxidoreductase